MREVTFHRRPVGAPGVCAKCGSQNRKWFVDLGFDLEFEPHGYGNYVDGVVYICNECFKGMILDMLRRWQPFYDGDTELQFWGEELPFGPSVGTFDKMVEDIPDDEEVVIEFVTTEK